DRVPDAALDPLAQALGVRDEEIVADELHALAELARERAPAVPVVLGAAVLERHHRIRVDDAAPEPGKLIRAEVTALEAVPAVAIHLARRRVERNRNVVSAACALGGV